MVKKNVDGILTLKRKEKGNPIKTEYIYIYMRKIKKRRKTR